MPTPSRRLRDRFGDSVVPVLLPIGEEHELPRRGRPPLDEGLTYSDNSGKGQEEDIPAELEEEAATAREQLIDKVAEADDALIEKYLEGEELTLDEILGATRMAVANGILTPAVPLSATKNIGTDRLLDLIDRVSPRPSPSSRARPSWWTARERWSCRPTHRRPPALFVFKTIYDQFSGRINLCRIFSGKIASDTHLVDVRERGEGAHRQHPAGAG